MSGEKYHTKNSDEAQLEKVTAGEKVNHGENDLIK
jgi:hypothetical protein